MNDRVSLRTFLVCGLASVLLTVGTPATAAPGDLDPSFSGDGRVTDGFDFSLDHARDVALLSDGDLLAVGTSFANRSTFALARYNSDGSRDRSFGSDGVVLTPVGAGSAEAEAVAVQTNGRFVVAGVGSNSEDEDFFAARYLPDGRLDTSFDGDGIAEITFSAHHEHANAIALQPDGKIVVAGIATNGSNDDFGIARLTTGGALDKSFSGDGKHLVGFGTGTTDRAFAVAVQSIQSPQPMTAITVGGSSRSGTDTNFAIARLTLAGALDTSFSGDGRVTTSFGTGIDEIEDLAVHHSTQTLAAAGSTLSANPGNFALARYTPLGELDTTFSGDGRHAVDFGGTDDRGRGVEIIQSSGKIVVAGRAALDFAVARLTSAGAADTTFSGDGRMTASPGGDDNGHAVAATADGKVVAAGSSSTGGNVNFALLRTTSGGAPDPTFDLDGIVVSAITDGTDRAHDVAIQPADGKIVVTGVTSERGGGSDILLARYTSDGVLEPAFGALGAVRIGRPGISEIGQGIAIQTDGKIVVAGAEQVGVNGDDVDMIVARRMPDGTPDPSFGEGGVRTVRFGGGFDGAAALAIQADGKIVLAGQTFPGPTFDSPNVAVARLTTNGNLDTTFSGDGKTAFGLGATDDVYDVAIQPADGKIVVAGAADGDVGLARLNPGGSLDRNFDADGKVVRAVGPGFDAARGVTIQQDGKIVIGGGTDMASGSGLDFLVGRFLTTGAPDLGFGGDGFVETPVGSLTDDVAEDVVLDGERILLTGWSSTGGDFPTTSFAAARYPSNGGLDPSFGTSGIVRFTFGHGVDAALATAIRPSDGKAVLAGFAFNGANDDIAIARLLAK